MYSPIPSIVRIGAICSKEIIQLVHDRLTFAMIIMIPLVQLVLFGYTINTDVRNVPAAVTDNLNNSFSRKLVLDLQAAQVLDFVTFADTPVELESLIRKGDVNVGLFIPADAEQRYYSGERPYAQLLVDGSDTTLAGAVRQLVNFPYSPNRTVSNMGLAEKLSVRLLYNPEKRSSLFTVPGLLGVILTMTMIMFTAIAIVRERERGNIELLITTPVKNLELMIGKILPYVAIGLLQVSVILFLGVILFDVPILGKLPQVYTACLVFVLANLTLGLMISTLVNNQLAAMQASFFILLPSILLSGFMFPFVAMPKVAQQLAEVLPLTHFLRIIRGVVLRGEGLIGLSGDIFFLLGFSLIFLVISTLRFTKRLE